MLEPLKRHSSILACISLEKTYIVITFSFVKGLRGLLMLESQSHETLQRFLPSLVIVFILFTIPIVIVLSVIVFDILRKDKYR
jgi:hypothetical protein